MRYLRSLSVIILLAVFAVPAQGQPLSIMPSFTAGNSTSPVNVRGGAALTYQSGVVGAFASAEYNRSGLSASAGPTWKVLPVLDVVTAATARQEEITYGYLPNRTTESKVAGGGLIGLRTGTPPVSVLVGVQHTGTHPWRLRTRFSQTSAIFGVGLSF